LHAILIVKLKNKLGDKNKDNHDLKNKKSLENFKALLRPLHIFFFFIEFKPRIVANAAQSLYKTMVYD